MSNDNHARNVRAAKSAYRQHQDWNWGSYKGDDNISLIPNATWRRIPTV